MRALRRGYEEAINDPESAVEALVDRAHVDRAPTERELDAVSPAFTEGAARFGALDPGARRLGAVGGALRHHPAPAGRRRAAFAPGF